MSAWWRRVRLFLSFRWVEHLLTLEVPKPPEPAKVFKSSQWMILMDRDEVKEIVREPMPSRRPRILRYDGVVYHQVREQGRDMIYRAD